MPFLFEVFLEVVSIFPVTMEDSPGITLDDVSGSHTRRNDQTGDGDIGCTRTDKSHLKICHIFLDDLNGIYQTGYSDHSSSLLVIMPNRNMAFLPQGIKNFKALGMGDIFQIDTTESWLKEFYGLYDFISIFGSQHHRKSIHSTKIFIQECFPLHNRQTCLRSDVAQTENPGAIRDNRNEIALVGHLISPVDILMDLLARGGNARRVPDGKIIKISDPAFGENLDLALVERMEPNGILRRLFSFSQELFHRNFITHFECSFEGTK